MLQRPTRIAGYMIAMAGILALGPPVGAAGVDVGTYLQEIGHAFGPEHGLADPDVRSMAVTADGTVFVGTVRGLVKWEGDTFAPVHELGNQEILALTARGGALLIATPSHVQSLDNGQLETYIEALPARPTSIAWHEDEVLLGTENGLFTVTEGNVAPVEELHGLMFGGRRVMDVAVGEGRIAVAGQTGLYEGYDDGSWDPLYPWQGDTRWAPMDVRAVAYDAQGRLWFAAPQGVGCRDLNGEWSLYTGAEGLPYNDFTCIATGADGAVWFGTRFGAVWFDGNHWAYREGKRWLPHNEVAAVALDASGSAWLGTVDGIAYIERRPMTLGEKAAYFEDEIDRYHRRTPYEYVARVQLVNPGDKSEVVQRDTDNDGQYTGLYGAAECFAYGATGDSKAKERATKAFEALAFLSEVTQGGEHPAPFGFPARTILPTDGRNPNEHNSPERDTMKQEGDAMWKVIVPRWPTSADGKWYWKCDTSSDELDGHYFLYALYYDLVAETDEEKERVRDVVRRVTDHLIEHDFRLVDHDGKPTRWARFSPKDLNEDPRWWAERGLNSMSMLTYLSIAQHVTGDAKYRDAYERLVNEHHYAQNSTPMPKLQAGPGSFVQFDDKMAFMNFYHLIQYESDPQLLSQYQNAIYYYWQIERYEMNPFFNFIYAALCLDETMTNQWGDVDLSPTGHWLEQSVDTLKRFPMNLVDWKHTNSRRTDVVPLPSHVREPSDEDVNGYRTNGYVIPIDERQKVTWSDDIWELDTGGEGHGLDDGCPFLLAYYMGLYHGFVK